MTHLPFIVAAYGVAGVVIVGFAVSARVRLGLARQRLRALDPRARVRDAAA